MKTIDVIRQANEMAHAFTVTLIEDMGDAPMTRPTPNGGNHPLWVLGHLAFAEGLAQQVVRGVDHPLGEWAALFAPGSEPLDDPGAYPSFAELLTRYKELHAANMALLEEVGDGGLDEPIASPPLGFEEIFRRVGDVFMINPLHVMNHRGQVADARRAAGRTPLSEPTAGG